MGTDRDEIGASACPCGKGTITVDSCSPDHPWGGGHWYEARLHCAGCSKTHAIFDNHGGKPALVLRSDVAKKEAAAAAWHAKIKAIEATSEYKSAKALVEKMVSQQPSMAAKHRVLRAAGLNDSSIASFRKNPQYRFSGVSAARAMTALGSPNSALDAHAVELDGLWQAAQVDPPAIVTGIDGLAK
jgi:hypothetical protein